MSQEFEKIVLEKLNQMSERLDKMDAKLDEHHEMIRKNTREIEGLTEVVLTHNDTLISLEKKFNQLVDAITVHKNLFIQFEHEFNLKFDALMKLFSMSQKKNEEYDEILIHYNSKFLDHDMRILTLEEKTKTI